MPEHIIDIEGLKNGDPRQIKHLVDTYGDAIFHLSISYVINRQDAEEITQDVFIACLRSIGSFEGKSSIKTWLYRIAINKSLDYIKSKNRVKRKALVLALVEYGEEETGGQAIEYNHPGIALESQEEMNALYMAIDQLPERQKTALILMKLDGKTQKEVGELMDLKVKAVESLIQRAKRNLRSYLDDDFARL